MVDKCSKCGRDYKKMTISRNEGEVGSYLTCRDIIYKKDGYYEELGCREMIWIKEPEYGKPDEEKDFSDRKVYKPKGAKCGKCGGPLGFYKNERGRWVPCELNGDDHWDICRESLSTGRYGVIKHFDEQRPAVKTKCTDRSLEPFDGKGVPW